MFSNAKKFFKKNILLIGIVAFVILIVVYFLFMHNFKEGLYSTITYEPPERQTLVKVSTLEKFYNRLTDPVDKDLVAPTLEIYKLIVSNYDNAFNTALLIFEANNEMRVVVEKIPDAQPPSQNYESSYEPAHPSYPMYEGFSSDSTLYEQNDIQLQPYQSSGVSSVDESGETIFTYNTPDQSTNFASDGQYNGKELDDYYARIDEENRLREKAQNDYYIRHKEVDRLRNQAKKDVRRTWSSRIDPGITALITNIIRWLPTGKPFYDKFALNNFYGLVGDNMNPDVSNDTTLRKQRLLQALVNTLYEDDQLSIVLGPSYAKSQNLKQPITLNEIGIAGDMFGQNYMSKLMAPFTMIALYAVESGSLLPDIIVNMISQLNRALANAATDQATIGQLNSKLKNSLANDATDQATIGQLTSNLKSSLANDATDQATITNLQSMLKNLQSQQNLAGQSKVTPSPIKIAPSPIKIAPFPMRRLW